MSEDVPKQLGVPSVLASRQLLLNTPHVVPLTKFVHKLREKMGSDASIPYFDPLDGGVNAELLFLLEAPGPRARNSGFVSRDNPDETAKNLHELSREAGIDRTRVVLWNVVPWYIGNGKKIRPANTNDINDGLSSLTELMQLLKNVRGVVLLGKNAQKSKKLVTKINPHLRIFECPHPSPLFVNRHPWNRRVLLEALKGAQAFLDENHISTSS